MSNTTKKIILAGLFLLMYGLLLYFLQLTQLRLDFSSFYAAALAYTHGTDPYKTLVTSYSIIPEKLPANLNPPFFLMLLSPLTHLNFKLASSLWFICSFILGNIGALLCFKISCSEDFFKKNWLLLLFIYLGMYSTLMNTVVGQIGGFLLFFIMAGYYFYLQRHDYLAGIFWGIIIAIKLFPALLFIFILSQKRYKALLITFISCLLAFLLPLIVKGKVIYSLYLSLLTRMLWFGDNWNGSLYGFLFRLFVDIKSYHNLALIKTIYPFLFIILLIWYWKKINSYRKTAKTDFQFDHRAFCLTLVMMLLMSPLGWLYYFSLLLMPLTVIWQSFNQEKSISNYIPLWVLALLLINFPLGYIEVVTMHSVLYKLSIHSFYFYGLVIIAYLLSSLNEAPTIAINNEEKIMHYLYPVYFSLALGIFITLTCFIVHLLHTLFPNIPAQY